MALKECVDALRLSKGVQGLSELKLGFMTTVGGTHSVFNKGSELVLIELIRGAEFALFFIDDWLLDEYLDHLFKALHPPVKLLVLLLHSTLEIGKEGILCEMLELIELLLLGIKSS